MFSCGSVTYCSRKVIGSMRKHLQDANRVSPSVGRGAIKIKPKCVFILQTIELDLHLNHFVAFCD